MFHRVPYISEMTTCPSITKAVTLTVILTCVAAQPLRACLNSLSGTTLDGHKTRHAIVPLWDLRQSRNRDLKVQEEKDPKYLSKHAMLTLDPNAIKRDAQWLTIAGTKRAAAEVRRAIHYQLRERLQFVKNKDPVVASLLFDYGALEAATRTVE